MKDASAETDSLGYYESPEIPKNIGFVSNKRNPEGKACISSRITTVIQVVVDHQRNDNCFNEPFAVSP